MQCALGFQGVMAIARPSPSSALVRPQRLSRPSVRAVTAQAASSYVAPSFRSGATELDALERFSTIVPDVVLSQNVTNVETAKAVTASRAVIAGIMANPANSGRFKFAIEQARYYGKDAASPAGGDRMALQVDKALANVGALMLEGVAGRVSAEVDPRLAGDAAALVERGRQLVRLFAEVGVPRDRILLRMPATWEAIQAAKALEGEGVQCHLVCVFSFVQAVAAAQAGASVLQINVGRLADWYNRNPGVLRDRNAPLEAGAMARAGYGAAPANPGLLLVEKVFAYLATAHPKTKIMASGLRTKAEALTLAGCDYLVVGPRVLEALKGSTTLEGYNDGLRSVEGEEEGGVRPRLTPAFAAAYELSPLETGAVDAATFNADLGMAGRELLDDSLRRLVDDANRLEPLFLNQAGGQE